MKKIGYFIIGTILIVASVLIYLYYNSSITVIVNPQDAKLLVNDTQITANQQIKFKPGSYNIKVTKDAYITYDKTIKLGIGGNQTINVNLRQLPVPKKVVDDKARFAVTSPDQKSLYYLSGGGKTMYAIDDMLAQKVATEAISPNFFSEVANIIWSQDRKLAIVKQKDDTFLYDFKRYDILHQELTPFEAGIGDVVWSPDSANIIYYYGPTGGETTLIKASKTNTNQERIYNFKDTKIRYPSLSWSPDAEDVTVVSGGELYILDLYTKQLTALPVGKNVSQARFTPDNKILYITADSAYICEKDGSNIQKLNFKTELNKITFIDSNNLIFSEKQNNLNNLYHYDLSNNTKIELVYNHASQVNPQNLILTSDENMIYFESDGYLYRMNVDTQSY